MLKINGKEIKNVKTKPLVEIKVKDYKKLESESKTKEIEQKVIDESKKLTKSLKQKLLESINDKKNQVGGKLNREEKKEFIKNLISNDL